MACAALVQGFLGLALSLDAAVVPIAGLTRAGGSML